MTSPRKVPAIGTIRVFDDVATLAAGAADLLCDRARCLEWWIDAETRL
jgi:hypothetical protein